MSEEPHAPEGAAAALAQSRTGQSDAASVKAPGDREPGEGELYDINDRLRLAHATRPYERSGEEPLYRRLPVFTLDASARQAEGRITELKIPYEPLTNGLRGRILEVDTTESGRATLRRADLDNPHVLIAGGYPPSMSDPRFHEQMVYAVAMQTYGQFQTALGRHPSWAFDRVDRGDGFNRLRLRPFGARGEAQAWYDHDEGEVVFGYFPPAQATPSVPNREDSNVFLSLCNDVIVHEVTHAVLDGLRADFFMATHPDVPAFHEAFADLVAAFQRFSYPEAVEAALGRARGKLPDAEILTGIGREFGKAVHPDRKALRVLLDDTGALEKTGYAKAPDEPHARARYLTGAVFQAFAEVYDRRSKPLIRLATGGSGVLPPGEIGHELTRALVSEVRRTALQFLTICIRAIDYCPPVDIRFGDYLRALLTADHDLVPDDDLGYREALIHAFGRLGIFGEGTPFMSEDALLWAPPRIPVAPIVEVSFGETHFDGDPGHPADVAELRRQAGAIGRRVGERSFARECGLVAPRDSRFGPDGYRRPVVASVRSARRVGPDGQITFDTVAEIIQERRAEVDGRRLAFFGGATLIFGPRGEVRYVIRKRVDHPGRLREQAAYVKGQGAQFWRQDGDARLPRRDTLRRLCLRPPNGDGPPSPAQGAAEA